MALNTALGATDVFDQMPVIPRAIIVSLRRQPLTVDGAIGRRGVQIDAGDVESGEVRQLARVAYAVVVEILPDLPSGENVVAAVDQALEVEEASAAELPALGSYAPWPIRRCERTPRQ